MSHFVVERCVLSGHGYPFSNGTSLAHFRGNRDASLVSVDELPVFSTKGKLHCVYYPVPNVVKPHGEDVELAKWSVAREPASSVQKKKGKSIGYAAAF